LERNERDLQVNANRIVLLEDACRNLTGSLRLSVSGPEVNQVLLTSLRQILAAHPGSCRVGLNIILPSQGEVSLNLPDIYRVEAGPSLFKAVENLGLGLEVLLN
jgi:hypothetical protein